MSRGRGRRDAPREVVPPTVAVDTRRVVRWGTVAWLAALVVMLAVPALHEGDRGWWPWAAASGAALGLLGEVYLGRGRGNAADA